MPASGAAVQRIPYTLEQNGDISGARVRIPVAHADQKRTRQKIYGPFPP